MITIGGWGRLATVALVVAIVAAIAWAGGFAPVDQALRSARFHATDRAPSGETLLVEIDAASLQALGVWPWPRTIHAEVLDRLLDLGAAEVVFDVDFSTASSEENDAALEAALQQAGGYAFLAAFAQTTTSGDVVINKPLPRFATHADPVLVNVDGDGTRLLRSVPAALHGGNIRSVAARLEPAARVGEQLFIDFGIDLDAVDRISVLELLRGDPDPSRFFNKQVIIGASAVELRDFFRVPRFGVIPGPLVQIAATETLKAGRPLREVGAAVVLFLSALLALAFFFGRKRLSLAQLAWLGAASAITVEVSALVALWLGALAFDTFACHVAIGAFILLGLLEERALRWNDYLRQQARLAFLATHDASTGAYSRQALLDQVEGQINSGTLGRIAIARLGRLDGAIVSLGHTVGESVARQAAQRLEQQIGSKPARIGPDLFAWSQPSSQPELPLALGDWVISRLEEPYSVEGHVVVLDLQLGFSALADPHGSAEELVRQAEVALGLARSNSANVAIFDPREDDRIKQRRNRDVALRRALADREFFLLYQPQHDLRTGDMIGVEALIRWRSSELGLVSPADFIPLAEETGLIVPLGAWVLEQSCFEAMQWQWQGRLSVNVSVEQFRLGNVVDDVKAALAKTGFPAARLDLEITESLFVDNEPKLLADLETLRAMGIGIALDDFGTGYSSLSYLTSLPIDKLKIDQSFVRQLPNPQKEVLVETIVLMAKRLGKIIVAEGIETQQQSDYLANLQCDVGQGYLFGRPSTPEALGLTASCAEVA